MSEKTGEDKGFKVRDKRKIFNETEKPAAAESQASATKKKSEEETAQQSPNNQTAPLPEINFATFILSLSTSSLMHLGEIPNPVNNKIEKNLPLAKQTIDLIDMLSKKTEGNLDKEEEDLVTNLLYDLKLKYVSAIKKG
jgi:PBP1b-binding outer membrane lipoprotein LpoB